jgi:hypothetical protein
VNPLAVYPNDACRRLAHPLTWTQVNQAGDRVETCSLCTIARAMVLELGHPEIMADAFVRQLRRETKPYTEESQ